jgi:hypothetical protein
MFRKSPVVKRKGVSAESIGLTSPIAPPELPAGYEARFSAPDSRIRTLLVK